MDEAEVPHRLRVRASVLTDVGRKRQVNEDWCALVEPDGGAEGEGWLCVVADGVGAYGTGVEASHTAGEAVVEAYRQGYRLEPAGRVRCAVEAGNRAVWDRRREYVRRGHSRPLMTTLLAVSVLGGRAVIANVGDCRAYLIRAGRIWQLSRDHTWVGEQVARGLLRPEEAPNHPRSHVITRSLGQHQTVEVDLTEHSLESGDRLVLCSDGLVRHLEDAEIRQLATAGSPDRAARTLLDLANARGGDDNITVGVLELVAMAPPSSGRPTVGMPPAAGVSARSDHEPTRGRTDQGPTDRAAPTADSVRSATPAPMPATPRRASLEGAPSLRAGISSSEIEGPSGDHLAALLNIAQRISSSLDLAETIGSVLDSVVEVTGGERGFIMLWNEQAGQLEYPAGRDLPTSGHEPPEFSRSLVQSVFQSGEPVRIGDALADSRFNQFESVVLQSLRSVLCAPLNVEGKRIGVVYVENRLGAEVFTEADLGLLCAFAGQAAVALEHARLHELLKDQVAENALMRTNQENVLRSISSAIISIDSDGRVLVFNRIAEDIFGVGAAYALHRPLEQLLPPILHRALIALAEEQQTHEDGVHEQLQLEVRLPHRGRAILTAQALPLADAANRRIGSVLIVDDITQQRLLDEARRRVETEKERIQSVFGRFLAPSVVEQLMENPAAAHLGGTRREVTVLFADIRGFTGISERHTPEEVVRLLNSYLACATEIILGQGGTLDKFLGDGVMAFFNAPLPQEDHVLAAVRAALEMQDRLRQVLAPGGSRVAFGVGINCGEGIVGNIGTAELMNYTVIGDVVNVAARLQGEARAGEVLLSGPAHERIAGSVEVEELGSMHVKGRTQPVAIYKIVRLRG